MLNVIGMVKVTGIKREVKEFNGERREKITASLYQPVKVGKNFDGSDKWDNEFVRCRFVGEGAKKVNTIIDKDKIELTQSVLRATPYKNGKVFHEIVVFDFVKCEDVFDGEKIVTEETPF